MHPYSPKDGSTMVHRTLHHFPHLVLPRVHNAAHILDKSCFPRLELKSPSTPAEILKSCIECTHQRLFAMLIGPQNNNLYDANNCFVLYGICISGRGSITINIWHITTVLAEASLILPIRHRMSKTIQFTFNESILLKLWTSIGPFGWWDVLNIHNFRVEGHILSWVHRLLISRHLLGR